MPDTRSYTRPKLRKRAWLWSFAVTMAATFAPSDSIAQTAAVESLGARTCSDLTDAQNNNQALYESFAAWAGGYLTAANAYESNTFDLTPWQPIQLIIAQIAQACADRPDATLAQIIVGYVTYLRENRLPEESELVRVTAGEQAVFIYRSVLEDLRTVLESQGAKIDDPEGTFGESFGKALLVYQRQSGVTESGLPDTQTLIRAFSDKY